MRTSSIKTGDIVYCNKRGRVFHAKVHKFNADGTIHVVPIERNISYRHVEASEIADHWARSTTTRRGAPAAKAQPTLELPLAL